MLELIRLNMDFSSNPVYTVIELSTTRTRKFFSLHGHEWSIHDSVLVVKRFDQEMLLKYETNNQESTTDIIQSYRKEINERLSSIIAK